MRYLRRDPRGGGCGCGWIREEWLKPKGDDAGSEDTAVVLNRLFVGSHQEKLVLRVASQV